MKQVVHDYLVMSSYQIIHFLLVRWKD